MAETRAEFLQRVADAHYAWEGEHLDDAPFTPGVGPDGSRPDYNMWYADMTPDADAQHEFVRAVGDADYVDDGSLPDEDDTLAPDSPTGGG